ncbi:hypothetical protein GCM10018953_60580 [Streptosporangium nondiastaticum]
MDVRWRGSQACTSQRSPLESPPKGGNDMDVNTLVASLQELDVTADGRELLAAEQAGLSPN